MHSALDSLTYCFLSRCQIDQHGSTRACLCSVPLLAPVHCYEASHCLCLLADTVLSLYPVLNCLTSRTRTPLPTMKADSVPHPQSVLSSSYAKRLWTKMSGCLQIYFILSVATSVVRQKGCAVDCCALPTDHLDGYP